MSTPSDAMHHNAQPAMNVELYFAFASYDSTFLAASHNMHAQQLEGIWIISSAKRRAAECSSSQLLDGGVEKLKPTENDNTNHTMTVLFLVGHMDSS